MWTVWNYPLFLAKDFNIISFLSEVYMENPVLY